MTASVQQNSTGNIAKLLIYDVDGFPRTGVAYNAAGLAVYFTPKGGTPVQITLSALNWTEKVHGRYEVNVPDAPYTGTADIDISGVITSGVVIGDEHLIVGYNPLAVAVGAYTGTPPTSDAIAAKILVTPANLLSTDASGNVTPVSGYKELVATAVSTQADIAALIAAWVDGGRLDLILDAINAKSALITTSTVTITSPVAADGTTLEVVQGDDYNNSDSAAITWTGDTADQWPDLTGATIMFGAKYGDTTISKTGTVVTATGTQSFRVELTSAETEVLVVSDQYRYDVQATLATSGRIRTLLRGKMEVKKSYTAPPA